jgi:hypothetical protein
LKTLAAQEGLGAAGRPFSSRPHGGADLIHRLFEIRRRAVAEIFRRAVVAFARSTSTRASPDDRRSRTLVHIRMRKRKSTSLLFGGE